LKGSEVPSQFPSVEIQRYTFYFYTLLNVEYSITSWAFEGHISI